MKLIGAIPTTVLLVLLVLLSGCGGSGRLREPDAIFLIVVDTLRADALSSYGCRNHETPAMDSLARSGVRFSEVHAAASWTVPSMGAMLTSRYPTQLGLIERPEPDARTLQWREKRKQLEYTLPLRFETLAELLSEGGFHTAAFINQPFINIYGGFLQGFSQWCYTVAEDRLQWHDTAQPIPKTSFPPQTDLGRADALLVREMDRWLGTRDDQKLFVWLHLLKPHWPYRPDPSFTSGEEGGWDVRTRPFYDGEVQEVDDIVAAALASIEEHVGLDRSLVVLVSDHGEEFGEHGMLEHGHSLHREVLQVPLILSGAGLPQRVVDVAVSTLDIMPTILELAGMEERLPDSAEGVSLLPALQGRGIERPLYSEAMLYGSTERSLRAGGYKLMFDQQGSPPYRLFELESDPGETNDLARSRGELGQRHREAMELLHRRLQEDHAAQKGDQADGGDVSGEAPVTDEEELLEALRALGYVR